MSTTAPYRSTAVQGRAGLRFAIRAELTKFATVRGWVVGMGVAALVTVLIGLLGPALNNLRCAGPGGQACSSPGLPIGPDGSAVVDRSYLVHRSLTGDGSITAEVTSLTGAPSAGDGAGQDPPAGIQPWSKAGVILRAGTGAGAAYAAMIATGAHGVRWQYGYDHDIAGLPGHISPDSGRWLRLTRSGETVTGAESTDGRNWSELGSVRLAGLPATVVVGLVVTSPEYVTTTRSFAGIDSVGGPTAATAEFRGVALRGSVTPGDWRATDTADSDRSGFQQSGDRFTVTGSGEIGPVVAEQGSRTRTIESGLVGAFAGLIVVIVIVGMAVSAEYRRGLIRTTFAATPSRGTVLAAKALVIGSITFVAGLVATAVVVPWAKALLIRKGLYVLPVAFGTELRIVVGTAALLAVAAVLTVAVATVLRRTTAAVTVLIVTMVLPYVLAVAGVLPTGISDWLLRLTPAAAFAVEQSVVEYPQVDGAYTVANGYFPLPPLAGVAVLCGYTAAALLLAGHLLRRRDA